jgi:signal transduction histidine kinase
VSESGPASEASSELERRISELERELERERSVRRASERAVFEATDAEQQQLAGLLHDTLSQTLNAARIYARLSQKAIERSCPDALAPFASLDQSIQGAGEELQSLTRWLRPARLDESGWSSTLADLCQLTARTVPCVLRLPAVSFDAEVEVLTELLRLAQLALHTLVRDGGVTSLEVEVMADAPPLVLEIRASAGSLTSDLASKLDARARATVGGSCTQRGNTLTCTLPSAGFSLSPQPLDPPGLRRGR